MQETFYSLPGPASLKLALVSDLHNQPGTEALASLRRQKPDLICVAGDFVLGRVPGEGLKMENCPHVMAFFRACAELAPTAVSLGNHEWMLAPEDLALLADTGIAVLDNGWTRWGECCIGGLSSGRIRHYRAFRKTREGERYPLPAHPRHYGARTEPETGWLESYTAQPGYKLLLCHQPEYWPRYLRDLPIDLTLSGHAHGGQIRLFGRGLFAPGQGLLPRYTSGIHEGRLVISRGLANTTRIPRLFNPTELVYVWLGPGNGSM